MLFVYVSFANMLACIAFLHMMICFERVLWCRWKTNECSSYKNTLIRWHDKLVCQTFWCELAIACYTYYTFFFYLFDPLNGQIGFWCLHESCSEFYPWHLGTGIMSFEPLQYKQSSKHCSYVILWGQNDIFILIMNLLQDTSHISLWLLHKRCISFS